VPIVPLYYSAERRVVERSGILLQVSEVLRAKPAERVETKRVRYRTLGCQLCTGCVESEAGTMEEIVAEVAAARNSERNTRAVDKDKDGSMEDKKREGYF
jgi:sulfate adenylyltransferase subunit 2